MVLSGKVFKGQKMIFYKSFEDTCDENATFRDRLENCLIGLCKEADIPVPIWLSKNTVELANFHKTSFIADQFVENVKFTRFEIEFVEKL